MPRAGAAEEDRSSFYTEVGRRVRAAREQRRVTQQALATMVSLTRTSVTNIERGRQKLLLHTFADIARALGVAPQTLLPATATDADSDLEEELKRMPPAEQQWIRSATRLKSERKE